MSTFIMLTRLSHQALHSPASLESLNDAVTEKLRAECPQVSWLANYVVLGPADYLDIFTAPDLETAMAVATVIRTFGHATTEVWGATAWDDFIPLARRIGPGPPLDL